MKLYKKLLIIPILYILYCLIMFFGQRYIIFPGVTIKDRPLPDSRFEKIRILTPESDCYGLYYDCRKEDSGSDPVVIYAHGNYELAEYSRGLIKQYHDLNCDVFLVEYPGYGECSGSPSAESINEVFVKAYDLVKQQSENSDRKIILHGVSIGGGAVCNLSRSRKIDAMLLQSTFTSLASKAGDYFLPEFLVRDEFDNVAAIRNADFPLLILHGEKDILIPFSQALKLDSLCPNSKLIGYDRGHGGWFGYSDEVSKFVRNVLDKTE